MIEPKVTQSADLTQPWRDAVAIMTLRAKDALGADYHSRLDKAQGICLAHGVAPGTECDYIVSSDSEQAYPITQDACGCKDALHRAPEGKCKHVLATWVHRRALKHMQAQMDAKPAAAAPAADLPEAPVSVSLKGTVAGRAGTLVTIRGNSVAEVKAKLAEAAMLFDAEAQAETPCGKIEGFGPDDDEAPYCEQHRTKYFLNHGKDGKSTWWSHRTPEGTFCRYKGK